jgi:GntR family transcriptional regulator/MocR family aminotransferase
MVAPPAWRERLLAARLGLDHGQPALEQLALADFMERGAYDRHLRRSARAYRRRRDAMVAALADELPSAVVSGAAAGLHMAVTVPSVADEAALVAACRSAGVALDGLGRHRAAPAPLGAGATLLLSFAAVPDVAAGHVARLIARAVRSTTLGSA